MQPTRSIVALALGGLLVACGEGEPPPPQPVPFSHKVHAGTNQIGCGTCHTYFTHSPIAGIPSAARCAGCHKFVDKEKLNVQLVNKAFEDGKPLVWNRIYRVPDHVYFTHERHIGAGLKCQQCHGDVEKMDVMTKQAPLTMGWCLDCHHERKAPTDCLTCHK